MTTQRRNIAPLVEKMKECKIFSYTKIDAGGNYVGGNYTEEYWEFLKGPGLEIFLKGIDLELKKSNDNALEAELALQVQILIEYLRAINKPQKLNVSVTDIREMSILLLSIYIEEGKWIEKYSTPEENRELLREAVRLLENRNGV